ncbi:MAG TPA: bifunctional 5,10-methylenetetrahydrofolate dehydrogenase/5,10-methenyltetrahydrofolate cyclohydrolase, partial [Alphaproteobacteria bacterium]|nr:bifunctional 5,10-methylenetetrahydrofolate dehydrogenase/5,10-methenyltetrahydrofolate cyclohydrolase [Alphaproteobacteria bacterium]
ISALNEDKNVHGILLQLPLPSSFDTQEILEYLNPLKDVDGLHPQNAGLLMQGRPRFIPCTPHGCLKLIKTVIPDLKGTTVGILGRSVLVGKPMAQLILNENATLIHMHSFTKNVKDLCKLCDVLVVAVGKPHLIDKSYLKSNVVVIDVGINRLENKKITGDVDFESALGSCQAITPVPGGVGPMTIAGLLQNTYLAYQLAIPT